MQNREITKQKRKDFDCNERFKKSVMLRCVTYEVNHAMLFRSSLNDNSSAALGKKGCLLFMWPLKESCFNFLETMFLPEAEKRIAKLVFLA